MRYQPYIKSLNYNFSALADNTHLSKLTLELSEPGLTLQSAALSYTDAAGEMLTFPLDDDLTFLAMNLPTQSLPATVLLHFSDGSAITQDLGLMFVPSLAGLNLRFEQAAPSAPDLTALLSWNVLESEINNTRGFNLSCAADSFFVGADQNEVALPHCPPLTPFNLSMQPDKMTGPVVAAQLRVITPKLVRIPDGSNSGDLGYTKQADATTLQEVYQLPRDQTLAEMQSPWQMHQPETASLGAPSSLINPKMAISHTVKEYVQQHDLSQHSEAFDYDDAKATGVATGPTTQTAWNQIHQGDKTILHAGDISQTRTVQTDQQSLKTPSVSNTYQDYDGNYSGETFEQTAQNYSEQTTNEQTSLNQHLFLAPKVTESVNQLNQSSQSIAISAGQHVQAGNQVHYPQSVNAQGQSVSFGGSGASKPGAFKLSPFSINSQNQDDFDLMVATVFAEADWSTYLHYQPNKNLPGELLYRNDVLNPQKFTPEMQKMFQQPYAVRQKLGCHIMKPIATSDVAIKAVASVIKNRMNIRGSLLCKPIVSQHLQFDAYIDPETVDFNNIDSAQWAKHSAFIQAYALKEHIKKPYYKKVDCTLDATDAQRVTAILGLISDIYTEREAPTTKANYYFSPTALMLTPGGHLPSWHTWPQDAVNQQLSKTDDFVFIDGKWP